MSLYQPINLYSQKPHYIRKELQNIALNPQNNLTIRINQNQINIDQNKSIDFIASILHLSGILSKVGGVQALYDHSFAIID